MVAKRAAKPKTRTARAAKPTNAVALTLQEVRVVYCHLLSLVPRRKLRATIQAGEPFIQLQEEVEGSVRNFADKPCVVLRKSLLKHHANFRLSQDKDGYIRISTPNVKPLPPQRPRRNERNVERSLCKRQNVERKWGIPMRLHRILAGARSGELVMHVCNEPSCIRVHPQHIKVGTSRDNNGWGPAQHAARRVEKQVC